MENKKNLETIFWKFVQLRDEMQDAAQTNEKNLDEQIEALTDAIKRFVAHFDDFKELSKLAEKQIQESIAASAKLMAEKVSQEFSSALEEKLSLSLSTLSAAHESVQQTLSKWRQVLSRKQILFIGAFCLGSFLMAFSIVWFLSLREPYKVSQDVAATYQMGVVLKEIWPKLSKKEKERLSFLSKQSSY